MFRKPARPALALAGGTVALLAGFLLIAPPIESWWSARAQAADSRPLEFSFASGATPYPGALQQRLRQAWIRRPPDYRPRTRHLREDGTPQFTNRLFLESSPYLLQHAHNPVDWYPWGEEAFETARRLGRPILLSVGYSTCHWCHVMEEESFEDLEIARYLNEHYVAIKVDREERPDIDAVYMAAVQALTGGGGWPMTVWLTPDRKPFYGATYLPPRDGDRGVANGFLTLLTKLGRIYDEQPATVRNNTGVLTEQIEAMLRTAPSPSGDGVTATVLDRAAQSAAAAYDPELGGRKGAPKFPSGLPLRFLLRYGRRTGEPSYTEMAASTLRKMAAGGIYDQVGGGFHRYSTDARWLVPHFEKMLYDNALLAVAALETFQATRDPQFAGLARDILHYLERDMRSPEGAFYSATDADSASPGGEREEGRFFTWTPAELAEVLTADETKAVSFRFGVTAEGNFEGRNILHAAHTVEETAEHLNRKTSEVKSLLDSARQKLYRARLPRPAPLRDEKIVTAWNGLAISAYSFAGLVLGDGQYLARAQAAAEFLLAHPAKPGRLARSVKAGRTGGEGFLDDYAFFSAGLIDLFEATGEPRWLQEAIRLDSVLQKHFEDPAGGFFFTGDEHEQLLTREKPAYDGAEPSGNSVAVLNLLRLYHLTGREEFRQRAERAMQAFAPAMERTPLALSEMLLAADFSLGTPKEVVIVYRQPGRDLEALVTELRRVFVPNRVLALVRETNRKTLEPLVPLVQDKTARNGEPTAYVCENQICQLPATDPNVFARELRAGHRP